MYIVKCYCHEDSKTANLVIPYKTKKSAENRKKKAIKSGCYHRVEITEEESFKFI
jgi:hypothetical protein